MHFQNRALLCLLPFFALPAGAQTIGGCPVFPANNIWNARVDSLPVHPRSSTWVNSISSTATLHQDFGGEAFNGQEPGLPITLVTGSQPKVTIHITDAADESEPGPYPFPANAKVEHGDDHHVIVVDTTNCILYETFSSVKNADNSWTVSSGSIFDLRQNLLRPQFWTSGDAAGLPIMPGLARYEEILEGEIRHALRFTAPRTTREYVWPARHYASNVNDPSLPPMGARFRLKANFDVSSFSAETQIILNGLKRYGMLLADNGSAWFVQGTFDPRWSNLADEWRRIPGAAFEAVDSSSLMESVDSAAVRGVASTPSLSGVAIAPAEVTGGQPATLRVTLSAPAPAGGLQVTLSSNNGGVASVSPAVIVAEGSSMVDVPLSTTSVASATTVTFTATFSGSSREATLTVNPPSTTVRWVAFIGLGTVTGGQGTTLRVMLNGPAPSGGAQVTLASSNAAAASLASSVTVPSGSSSADVPITTSTVSSTTAVVLTATLGGASQQATLTVNPGAGPSLQSAALLNGSTLTGGQSTALRVTLSAAAPSGGIQVSLASSNAGAASLASTLTVPSGATSADAPVNTSTVSSTTAVVLTATLGGNSRQATLTVNAPAAPSLQSAALLNGSTITGGQGTALRVTLSAAAPTGGIQVTLTSSNAGAASLAATVTVPSGTTSADAPVATSTVSSATAVVLTATLGGNSLQSTLTVNPSATPTLHSAALLNASTITGGQSTALRVTLSAAAPSGGILIALTSNNSSAASLASTVTVPSGSASADVTVSTSTVSSTTAVLLTASMGGLSRQATLSVNPPAPTLQAAAFLAGSTVMAGQSTMLRVSLSSVAGPGGVTVGLSSSNSAAASLAGSVTIPSGSSSADILVSAGAVASDTQAVCTATYNGISRQASLTITPAPSTAILRVAALTAFSVTGGANVTLMIGLTEPAPQGGLLVGMSSSNAGAASLPASVLIPAGYASFAVTVTTAPPPSETQVILTASAGGVTRQATLAVKPGAGAPTPPSAALSSLVLSETSVQGGTSVTGTVSLNNPAPSGGFTVSLASTNSNAASATLSAVQVPAGQRSASFAIQTGVVSATTLAQIRASALGLTVAANLTVNPAPAPPPPPPPPTPSTVSLRVAALTITSVQGGTGSTLMVGLTQPAPTGGLTVALSSSDPAVASLPAVLYIPEGYATVAVAVTTFNPGTQRQIALTASAGGVSQQALLTVRPPTTSAAAHFQPAASSAVPLVARLSRRIRSDHYTEG